MNDRSEPQQMHAGNPGDDVRVDDVGDLLLGAEIATELREEQAEPTPVDPLHRKLAEARRSLLDLTLRNRLINTRRKSRGSGTIEVLDERAAEVFRILVKDGREMSFLARPERKVSAPLEEGGGSAAEAGEEASVNAEREEVFDASLVQPEEEADEQLEQGETAARHRDSRLQTGVKSEVLQKRLLRMYYDARTAQEEQGVNILYLALGFLKWHESESSDLERFAPLILIPVELDRTTARSKFRIRYAGEEIATNLSLQTKLAYDFGITLPDLPGAGDAESDAFDPAAYFAAVRETISAFPRWSVIDDDIVLGFYSFAKLLMYRDLDPRNWPEGDGDLTAKSLIQSMLEVGFDADASESPLCGYRGNVDDLLPVIDTKHVLDADSSQSLAIEEVRRGRNLVMQGPPGTGKSQTIANIIAAAVGEGKRVLFLAEKQAALEVVKRRLTNIHLGDMCLELHSNKARKKQVLEELERTMNLGPPQVGPVKQVAGELQQMRDRLNAHSRMMHAPFGPGGLTPYRAIGELVMLRHRGAAAPDFRLEDAPRWSGEETRERRREVEILASHVEQLGVPTAHPWRGVMLTASLPTDRERLAADLPAVAQHVDALAQRVEQLRTQLGVKSGERLKDASKLITLGNTIADAPELDPQALNDQVWNERRGEITKLLENGRTWGDAREALRDVVVEAGWSLDPCEARRDLAAHGRGLFRLLSSKYRAAKAALRGILRGALPKSLEERLAILDRLIEARAAKGALEFHDALGRSAFGRMWSGADSEWDALQAIAQWEQTCRDNPAVPDGFRAVLLRAQDRGLLRQAAQATEQALLACREALQALVQRMQLDLGIAFANDGAAPKPITSLEETSITAWRERITQWLADPEGMTRWIGYRLQDEAVRALGIGPLCERVCTSAVRVADAIDQFDYAYYEAVMRAMLAELPELQSFNGMTHEQILQRFRALDQKRMRLACQEIAHAHYERIPRGGGGIGEIGVIRNEIAKKSRHMPLRKLLRKAGNAVTAIKPVFMMSPMSIAQYVKPGALEFDVLVIDEASQVQPVDALGAAARAKQMLVVGDDKQLPPTRFFNRVLEDGGIDDEADVDGDGRHVGDLESVLGLCKSQGMRDCMLRWHYRSRHHSLIAVSNREFYSDQLYIIPSPTRQGEHSGVRFHHICGGIYDRSGSRTNRNEAQAVASAVRKHAEQTPRLSLGIGAFSVAQRDAIIDELERMRRERPDLESFFARGGPGSEEPFFVKNLENIQGDERDVIFISVGYGRDVNGYMSMNFGPLSNEGGERRLNVLITRAKLRCEIFSSITDDDIDLNRATGLGPAALKTYLNYARTGQLGIPIRSGREHDSAFEEAVSNALRERGWQVDPQVDAAGFFIDLAVVHPQDPGRYVLGIECDGASYHSARSARDRDRIRQNVLEQRGWRVHRIWSTDWFNRPVEQIEKTERAIERAISAPDADADADADRIVVEREAADDAVQREALAEASASFTQPYREASFKVPAATAIPDLSTDQLAEIVARIVGAEGPVHVDEIAQRVIELWGIARAGSRIRAAVDAAIAQAERTQIMRMDRTFLMPVTPREIVVRDRSEVSSASLRRVEMLPPAEVRRCIGLLVEHHAGASREQLVPATARQFGYRSTSAQLRTLIEAQIDAMVQAQRIIDDAGNLRMNDGIVE